MGRSNIRWEVEQMKPTKKKYREWLKDKVFDQELSDGRDKLLNYLFKQEFVINMDEDENRRKDGLDLVYRYGYEHKYTKDLMDAVNFNEYCSVLEMLVALAIRCEEHFMLSDEDRTNIWFWRMLDNLGLIDITDDIFKDELEYIHEILETFMSRRYDRNGEGGNIFITEDEKIDMRDIEIWYQMFQDLTK